MEGEHFDAVVVRLCSRCCMRCNLRSCLVSAGYWAPHVRELLTLQDRVCAAGASGACGIQELVDQVCAPDFHKVTVSKVAEDAAAASTKMALCGEACRALAAASASSAADCPLLIVAPVRWSCCLRKK